MSVIEDVNRINDELSIALCTCEGSFYLPEQLESLVGQSFLPGELVVFDDASSDNSAELIEAFAGRAPFKVRLALNEKRLGAVNNFSQAISLCRGDYVALCDQDDIWLPDKLELTMQRMKEAEEAYGKTTPLLVHTDLKVIDSAGIIIAPSFMKLRKLKPAQDDPLKILCAQNFVTGCTVLINRPLIDAAIPIPESAMMHDWWLALVAAARGKIIYEPQATVLYRQHEKNVIGSRGFYTEENIARLLDMKNMEKKLAGTVDQLRALKGRLEGFPNGKRTSELDYYLAAASQGGVKALLAALRGGIRNAGLFRSAVFYLLLLKGSYTKEIRDD